jgi:uncharacterized linocin/CFP29 family protein
MDPALASLGWTEDQWHRISSTVREEAQRARLAAQLLPTVGPEDGSTLAVPGYQLGTRRFVPPPPPGRIPRASLIVDSDPNLYLTRIAVNVELRSHEVADSTLSAALVMFRRAATVIARVEDSVIFYGRRNTAVNPPRSALNSPVIGVPMIYDITDDNHNVPGLYPWRMGPTLAGDPPPVLPRGFLGAPPPLPIQFRAGMQQRGGSLGDGVVNVIIGAINRIENKGYFGPFACALGTQLFEALVTPAPTLVLPRDRVMPFLQGPLLRSSELAPFQGVVVSLAGAPVEMVIAADMHVRFLQQTLGARLAFRVSERIALRIKDRAAIQWLSV